jgi:hypothetical protein
LQGTEEVSASDGGSKRRRVNTKVPLDNDPSGTKGLAQERRVGGMLMAVGAIGVSHLPPISMVLDGGDHFGRRSRPIRNPGPSNSERLGRQGFVGRRPAAASSAPYFSAHARVPC